MKAAGNFKILQEGHTCWRIARAERAAVLIDGAAYFKAVRDALLKAQRSVFILGWDIDSRVELVRGAPQKPDEPPRKLKELLTYLVRRRPHLQIYMLLWDYSVVYALEREPLPSINLDWATPQQIKVCLDDVLPLGASHHQKIVVIDDAIAFCGGLDLTIRRWDTAEHKPNDPRRRGPDGKPYDPFHDIQMCVDGEAATALGKLARQRWLDAACERPLRPDPKGNPWPDDLAPDFTDVNVAVARTLPALYGAPGVREVESLYLSAIERAERLIYIENQFLTADTVAECLARRLTENSDLEVLLVSPGIHESWLEARSMKAGRIHFMQRLRDGEISKRVRLVYPSVSIGERDYPIMVHAKLMIVDNLLLRVGSSNLNKRSMGIDTECDLAIEAVNDDQRRSIANVRNRLIGEHLGVPAQTVAETLEETGSLFKSLDALAGGRRGLRPIRDDGDYGDTVSQTVADLADPEQPIEAAKYVGDMFGGQPAGRVLGRIGKLVLIGFTLIVLAFTWRFTLFSTLAQPDGLRLLFGSLASSHWAPLIVPALYVFCGLIAFPVTVLITATAMVFETRWALVYAGAGSLLSAAVTYQIGALAGRNMLRHTMGLRLNRISRSLARKGVLSVAAIRLVPIAPFTFINLVAGVSHIRFIDYLLGTILGMAPGILILTALGDRLVRVLAGPSAKELAMLAVIVCLWLAISVVSQFVVTRLRAAASA